MEKEIEDINATLTLSFLNRRHTQHLNQSWACAHGCLCSLLRKGQVLTGIRHKGKRKRCLSVPSRYLSTRMLFRSEGRDHPSSLSPGKLAADIEGFFCAESKMTFQKSIFVGLDVKLNAFKKLNENISYCHPLPQQP